MFHILKVSLSFQLLVLCFQFQFSFPRTAFISNSLPSDGNSSASSSSEHLHIQTVSKLFRTPCLKTLPEEKKKSNLLKKQVSSKGFHFQHESINTYFLQSDLMENEMTELHLPGMAFQWQHIDLAADISMFWEFVNQRT